MESTGFGGNKPKFLFCFLCGREFGASSLEIHISQCKTKFENEKGKSAQIPSEYEDVFQRIKKGEKLSADECNQFNNFAENLFKEFSMSKCPNCGRRFLQDRLEVHLRSCKGESPQKVGVKTNTGAGGNKNLTVKKDANPLRSSAEIVSNSTKLLEEKLNKELGKSPNKGSGGGGMGGGKSSMGGKSPGAFQDGKPLFLMCYICGREFGKSSLEIHIKQCIEKNTDGKKVPKVPKELAEILDKNAHKEEITNNDIINYNEVANKIFKEHSMKTCNGCGRRFLPDRLEVHLRSCKSADPGTMYKSKSPGPSVRPRMQMCPLCGREFGSLSLPIHMKTCKDRFELEQSKLPKNQRRSAETIIEKYHQNNAALKSAGDYNLDKVNSDAFDIFNKEALIPCDLCGRTFLPDRLTVHLRSCKGPTKKKEK
jgi:hypothetical protein